MYTLKKQEGHARRGEFETPHGTVQTPVFMNVGTAAAIKGALSAADLKTIGCQIELSNTYHLHLRPGDEIVKTMGGLHKFMTWDRPILTDSGGFQIFSLASLRKISEEGVKFNSHIDGRHIFMGPEESMRIQSNLGSDIAMAFDECIKIPSPRDYVQKSCDRTYRWLARCKAALNEYNSMDDAVNPGQMLFGINQGTTFADIRIEHMKKIAELDLPGYLSMTFLTMLMASFNSSQGMLSGGRRRRRPLAVRTRTPLSTQPSTTSMRSLFLRVTPIMRPMPDTWSTCSHCSSSAKRLQDLAV